MDLTAAARTVASVVAQPVSSGAFNDSRLVQYFFALLVVLAFVYGVLSFTQYLLQFFFSQAQLTYQDLLLLKGPKVQTNGADRKVVVVIPSFNEEPQLLKKSIESCLNQQFAGSIDICIVDDCSVQNQAQLDEVYAWASTQGAQVYKKNGNEGKRRAQKYAFDRYSATHDYFVTIDSDTVLDAQCVQFLVSQMETDGRAGAATGQVLAINKDRNLLTQLINIRYWYAFNIERSAQSFFGTVFCCSGPCSIYRAHLIAEVKERYVNQRFLGEECTYGDDRHLTNLVLEKGYKIFYNSHAFALTAVPETLRGYIKQQIRWNKSFYRELIWSLPAIRKQSWYLTFELLCQALLPFLLLICLLSTIAHSFMISNYFFLNHIWWFLLVSIIKTGPGFIRTADIYFLTAPLYSLIHLLVMLPLRVYALLTLKDRRWGTR